MDASSTGRRVGVVIVPQSFAQPQRGAATSERTMARDDDSSPTGRTGAMEARETRQTTQQSIGMRARARGGE
eukprot:scaffold23990_cov47-Cyclotella_meneghiniana.AAC.7